IEPDQALIDVDDALQPDRAGFFVPVLDAAARIGDLVGAHGGVADEDDAIVAWKLVQDVPGRGLLVVAAPVVLPHALIEAVVEVEELKALELGSRRAEELLAELDVRIH